MIGRTGLFQSVVCPFFAAGSCERPYCHFKHVKRESPQSKSDQGYKASFSAFPIAKNDETPGNVVISQVESESPPGEELGQSYRGSFFEPLPNPAGIHRPSLLGAGPPSSAQVKPHPEATPIAPTPPENEIAKSLEAVNQAIMQLQKTMENVSGTSAIRSDSTTAVVNVIKQVQNNLINGAQNIPSKNGKFPQLPAVGSWRQLPSSSVETKSNSSCSYRPTPLNQLDKVKSDGSTTEEYSPEDVKPPRLSSFTAKRAVGLKQKADSSTDVKKIAPTSRPTVKTSMKKPLSPEKKDAILLQRRVIEGLKNDKVLDTLRADLLKKQTPSALLSRIKKANEVSKPPVSQPITSSQSVIDMSDIFGDDSDSETKDLVRIQAKQPVRTDVRQKTIASRTNPLLGKPKPTASSSTPTKLTKPPPLSNGFAVTPPTAELDLDSLMNEDNFQFGLEDEETSSRQSFSPDFSPNESISTTSTSPTLPIRVCGDKMTGKIRVAYKSAATDTASQKRMEQSCRPLLPTAAEMMIRRNLDVRIPLQSAVELPPSNEQLYGPAKKLKATGSYGSLASASGSGEIRRTAHMPKVQASSTSSKRPVIPLDFGAKVPTNIRQRYLSLMIDECLRFCKSEAEAYEKGLTEEKLVYTKSSSKSVYLNSAVMAIKRLRDNSGLGSPLLEYADAAGLNVKQVLHDQKHKVSVSHDAIMGVKHGSTHKFTVGLHRNRPKTRVSPAAVVQKAPRLYDALTPYLLTKAQMVENGYPLPDPDIPGRATLLNEDAKIIVNNNPHRVCSRCGKQFSVDEDGFCTTYEECTFHWGRAYKRKVIGSIDARYSCCQSILGSEGCSVCKFHVSDQVFASSLEGYLGTVPPDEPPVDGNFGVFALDCEMVYTTAGIELAKVTVIGEDGQVAYETIIRPYNAILDCNTRFSGLKQEDIDGTKTRLEDVQCHLLNMFNSETILIGHSLESDLKALKLFHTKIVDTAVVFPHRMGPPYKRALKNLALEFLQRIIQDDVGGHDSCEDARTCLDLMKLRLKEDATKAKYPIV